MQLHVLSTFPSHHLTVACSFAYVDQYCDVGTPDSKANTFQWVSEPQFDSTTLKEKGGVLVEICGSKSS